LQTSLLGVMAQRLIRVLCPQCKQEDEIEDNVWSSFIENQKIKKPEKVYSNKGCEKCRFTGFIGRTGLYEILPISKKFSSLISNKSDINKLKEQFILEKIDSIKISGIKKVIQGITSIEEVLKVINH